MKSHGGPWPGRALAVAVVIGALSGLPAAAQEQPGPSLQQLLPQLLPLLQGMIGGGVGGVTGAGPTGVPPETLRRLEGVLKGIEGRGDPTAALVRIDLDDDGQVDPDEAAAWYEAVFRRRDANGDGVLSRREFSASVAVGDTAADRRRARNETRRLDRLFSGADANADRRVSKAEFLDLGARRYRGLDRDGDGRVSAFEYRGGKLF